MNEHLDTNRRWWDERVPIHVESEFYDVEGFRSGASTLREFEVEEIGPVEGRSLLHLQCHFGLDTMSWARRGASVVGLDFSEPAVQAAQQLADELELDARFVAADVYGAPEALGGERFEIVYTGLGALNWLPDLERWAAVVGELLTPGGRLYLSEFHPITWIFDDDELRVVRGYFHDPEGELIDLGGTYADMEAKTEHNVTREWTWTLADVVSAVTAAGLRLEFLHEHDYTLFPLWPQLERHVGELEAGETYRFPAGAPRLPLMYSLRATRD